MTDTRNRNHPGNFALEQRAAARFEARALFVPPTPASVPGRGLGTAGTIPGSRLAANFVAIDSNIRGIGVANLVKPNPAANVVAQLYPLHVSKIVPDPAPLQALPRAAPPPNARPSYL